MLTKLNLALGLILFYCGLGLVKGKRDDFHMEVIMPPKNSGHDNDYFCTAIKFNETLVVSGVDPIFFTSTVHHINLYGCSALASELETYPTTTKECKGMPACPGGSLSFPVLGWVPEEDRTGLLPGKCFVVGPGSSIQTLFVQVHYEGLRPENDVSGVRLHYHRAIERPAPYTIGEVAYQYTKFTLQPHQESIELNGNWCYDGFDPLIGYAMRPHAHRYGTYQHIQRHSPGGASSQQTIIGTADPSKYHGYVELEGEVRVLHGDSFNILCQYNTEASDVEIPAGIKAKTEEMCVVHLAYYSKLPFSVWRIGPKSYLPEALLQSQQASLYLLPWPAAVTEAHAAGGGDISGIAKSPTGDPYLWLFSSGDRSWKGSFTKKFKVRQSAPIDRPTVLQIDVDSGELVKEWGSNTFYMPHMISLDRQGNIWTADAGAHQVFKHSPDGEQLLELGQPLTPGRDGSSLCQPTHAVVSQQGTIYVADGHCNSRIVQYSADGTFEKEYLLPASAPGFPAPLPHSLALNECDQMLWVADQAGGRVLGLNLTSGEFVHTWAFPKESNLKPYAVRTNVQKSVLVLAWDGVEGGTTKLVMLTTMKKGWRKTQGVRVYSSWHLPGLVSPHDLEISPAPLDASRTGARGLAVLVTDVKSTGRLNVKRYIIENDAKAVGQNGVTPEQYLGKDHEFMTFGPPMAKTAHSASNTTTDSNFTLYFMMVVGFALVCVAAALVDKQLPKLRGHLQGYRQPAEQRPGKNSDV